MRNKIIPYLRDTDILDYSDLGNKAPEIIKTKKAGPVKVVITEFVSTSLLN